MNTVNMPIANGKEGLRPTKVILHAIAEYVIYKGHAYHAVEWLRREGTSAHVFVTPSGTVIRSRDDDQVAWHARAHGHNFKSVGIEFLVPGAHEYASFKKTIETEYLTPQQYEAGVKFCREEWVEKKGLFHFVEHSTIDSESKTDPGAGFPLNRFLKDIGVIV